MGPVAFCAVVVLFMSEERCLAAAAGDLLDHTAPSEVALGESFTADVTVENTGTTTWGGYYYPTWYVVLKNLSWKPFYSYQSNYGGAMTPGSTAAGSRTIAAEDMPTAAGGYSVTLECWHRQSKYSSTMQLMANCPVTLNFSVTSSGTHTLDVVSEYGMADPPVGTDTYTSGTNLTCLVTNSPAEFTDSTSWKSCICTGWVGTGSVPASGSTTNTGSFSLNEDSSITWLWAIQDLVLSNQTVSASTNYSAQSTISARAGYTVLPSGNVTFEAGDGILLQDGFTSQSGSMFRAAIGGL